ncbi:unnamed protein product [Clonostachys chloroleuca]|uniref:Uncharacterized protein n=1 Tax=Clonostachys chloroleuca TaxID=1926264 RepID=A0AA35VLQ2_9HYPO|nr:unnamed protein product [Clonostachys chloroleuca]
MLANSTVECRDIWRADDQLQFCADDFASLAPYYRLYFCASSHLRPLILALQAVWLGLLLFVVAITARNFLSTNPDRSSFWQ